MIPSLTEHLVTKSGRYLLAARAACSYGRPGSSESRQPVPTGESAKATGPLVEQIAKQAVKPPDNENEAAAQQSESQQKTKSAHARRSLELKRGSANKIPASCRAYKGKRCLKA